tara:strand:- start:5396 stop:6631 length:1236 start_codon:yes stop_codon:yes gene_type:complete
MAGGFVPERPDTSDYAPMQILPRSFGDEVAASHRAMTHLTNSNARGLFHDRIWTDRIREVEAATGERLPHPFGVIRERFAEELVSTFLFSDEDDPETYRDRNVRFLERRISEIREANPEAAERIHPPEWWEEEMRRRAAEIDEEASRSGLAAGLLGGISGAFRDPVNLATMPIGGASRTVLAAAGKEALINAGVELLNLPIENEWRQELGLDGLSFEDGVSRVAIGAGFGGVFGAGGKLIGDAFGRLTPRRQAQALRELVPDNEDARFAADMLDRQADFDEANPFGPGLENDALHTARLTAAQRYASREADFQFDLFDDVDGPARPAGAPPAVAARMEDGERAPLVSIETLRAEQAEALTARPDDVYPSGQLVREGMGEEAVDIEISRAEIEDGIARDLGAVERLRGCVPA